MRVLFVHPNYPAQFGHVAAALAQRPGWSCQFVCRERAGWVGPVELIPYTVAGSATSQTHHACRPFENVVWHAHGIYTALKARPDVRPDLIVGHSGIGSTLFLRELFPEVPFVGYFEYFYRPRGQDIDFRPEFPPTEEDRLRALTRNASILLDLENCAAGYSPTNWQRSLLPAAYQDKVRVIFDGIDTDFWRPQPGLPRVVNGLSLPDGKKVVTYASRGLEAQRGFDVFMRFAGEMCRRRDDVVFVIAGQDRSFYGADERFTGGKSFLDWVLSQGEYDLSRFAFLGPIPPAELAKLFALSDLHVYLTVPFTLSWSLFNAMACGALVLVGRTEPVRELVEEGKTGLLCDFDDVSSMVERADGALDSPCHNIRIRNRASEHIQRSYDRRKSAESLAGFFLTVNDLR